MWNLGNRDIIVLISVISGCAILCNVLGPLVTLQVTLVLVICGWFTLVIADDTLFTPHALLILDYIEAAGRELNGFLENIYIHAHDYFVYLSDIFKQLYRVHIVERMAQRRRSTYQLSSESYPSSRNSSRMSLVAGLSPIARGNYRSDINSSNVENHPFASADTMLLDDGSSRSKVTSTPLVSWRKEETRNGDIFGANHNGANKSPWSRSPSATLNHSQSRSDDTTYSAEASAWGTSISPKMRSRAGGIKTVQTVAGPLLASTRYNIDPKVYSDVTSPGLTTRLTKYATEANTKLTHQSQYGTGQFPRVNLNCSPTPLISTKPGKMRMPVTVRVAPPKSNRTNNKYEHSPPDRQKILSNICHAESKTPMSVVQVLREISLKRHASREDVTFELAKKQRTDGVFSDGLENLEEMTQKRTRDDSSRSDEEVSPQNKSVRPAKRSKMPSCYEILSSLSSSINVSAGVKRKALDTSRSGTPDVGKHFKSLDSSHGDGLPSPTITRTISEPTKPSKRALNELDTSRNSDVFYSPHKKMSESVPQKGILKSPPASKISEKSDDIARERFLRDVESRSRGEERGGTREIEKQDIKIAKESPVLPQPQNPVKLTDKLFMKAEPQNIDKLKTLIEEHGSIKPRFTTNDTDEIKKSDIVNMRQTSMKTRLKSMFDAISGKAPSKINPEVVIQAEEAKAPTSSSLTASLTSLTSTTNVNTSPIATSAVVPIIGKAKPNTTPAKHVTFQFTSTETSAKTSIETSAAPVTETIVTSSVSSSNETKKITSPVADAKPAQNLLFQSFNTPSSTASVPQFFIDGIGSASSTGTSNAPAVAAKTTNPVSLPSIATTTATSSPLQFNSSQIFNASTTSAALSGSTTSVIAKTTTSTLPSFNSPSQPAATDSQTSSKFSRQGLSSGSTLSANPSTPSFKFGNPSTTAPPAFGIATSNSFANAATPATTSAFSFGSNAPPQSTETKPFSFGGAASTSQNTSTVGSITTSQSAPTSLATTTSSTGGFSFSSSTSAPMKSNSLFGSVTTASSTPNTAFANPASTAASFSFGSNATATLKPSFSFGSNAATTAVTSASTGSSISFGTPSNNVVPSAFGTPSTTSSTTTASTLPSIFGTPSTTAAPTAAGNLPSLFGTPSTTAAATTASNQPSLFGTPSTSASAFGTATTAPTFETTSNQSAFSGTSNAFGTPKTMETPAFGTNMGAPPAFSATSTTSSLFSGASSNVASTTAPPAFGTSNFGQTKPPPAFGATASNSFANGGGTGTSLFGSQPTTTAAFGTATPAATVSTPMFGTPSTPAQSFGTPTTAPPPFGATNTSTTSFGAVSTAAPTFGTINTSTPAFGMQNTAAGASGNQNCTSSVFSTTNPPAFGAVTTAAPPAFGTSINSSSGFGNSATSGFGAPSNPPPAFSSGSGTFGGFGAGNNATSPFASQPATGSTSFGTPSSTAPAFGGGNSGTSSFSFGGSQTAAQPPQQQQTPVFAFGGAAPTNNAPGGSAPFQFGSSAPQTGGFNFTGAPSTPALNFSKDGTSGGSFAAPALGANSFNAPTTGGMFSIGSGSTGPRTRPSRRRQR